ncbi:MAG TPA: non-homologous end-joining DNA ligase [Actinomycetota bacterium]|nr:non-homologous end-joining DNA ligase [Actinomycetota bacterium]
MGAISEAGTTVDWPVELPAVRRRGAWVAHAGDVEVRLTNLSKVFWPESGYTKGDLVAYYFNVALALLPHVADRPLTLKRMPDGVGGIYFYEKDAPAFTPSWMPTLDVRAGTDGRVIRFVTVRDVASLLWLANAGCIELHAHHTRGPVQERPTYAVFDLDPYPPAAFDDVRRVAALVKVVLDGLGLRSYPKTSGATGMQVFVPLDGRLEYRVVRAFVGALSRMIHAADPASTTLEWEVARRAGRVFLDANINRAGASIASAYSARARWDATVSMPFAWDALDAIDPYEWTIATAPAHVALHGDPFAPVAAGPGQSLGAALDELRIAPD